MKQRFLAPERFEIETVQQFATATQCS